MFTIALRMLFGDRTKYLTLVLSLAFAAMLMNQQGAIFLGLLNQATGPLQNVNQPDLWVTDPDTQWVAEYRPLSDQSLARIRSLPGVAWAEPFFNGYAVTELPEGPFKRVQILGLSRSTLVGRPPEVIKGRIEDLWIPDAIMVEESSAAKLGGVDIGDVIKINDRRAVIVGICRARLGFESNAIIYTTFDNAISFSPTGRENISYVLVKVKEEASLPEVQARINDLRDVAAFTRQEFKDRSIEFIIVATGIGVNFGITIALGFVVGLLLSASVFYQFTIENLRHFAVLKAMGAGPGRLTLTADAIQSELSAFFPWQLMVGSFIATLLTIALGSILSLRRVLRVSPGMVFGG